MCFVAITVCDIIEEVHEEMKTHTLSPDVFSHAVFGQTGLLSHILAEPYSMRNYDNLVKIADFLDRPGDERLSAYRQASRSQPLPLTRGIKLPLLIVSDNISTTTATSLHKHVELKEYASQDHIAGGDGQEKVDQSGKGVGGRNKKVTRKRKRKAAVSRLNRKEHAEPLDNDLTGVGHFDDVNTDSCQRSSERNAITNNMASCIYPRKTTLLKQSSPSIMQPLARKLPSPATHTHSPLEGTALNVGQVHSSQECVGIASMTRDVLDPEDSSDPHYRYMIANLSQGGESVGGNQKESVHVSIQHLDQQQKEDIHNHTNTTTHPNDGTVIPQSSVTDLKKRRTSKTTKCVKGATRKTPAPSSDNQPAKRKRTVIPAWAKQRMDEVFVKQPYISRQERYILAQDLHLNERVVKLYFGNRRQQLKKVSTKKLLDETTS